MKRLFVFLSVVISLSAFGQEDTLRYIKYPMSQVQYGGVWAKSFLRLPDTARANAKPGAFGINALGTKIFLWNGTTWVDVTGGSGAGATPTLDEVLAAGNTSARDATVKRLYADTVTAKLYKTGTYGAIEADGNHFELYKITGQSNYTIPLLEVRGSYNNFNNTTDSSLSLQPSVYGFLRMRAKITADTLGLTNFKHSGALGMFSVYCNNADAGSQLYFTSRKILADAPTVSGLGGTFRAYYYDSTISASDTATKWHTKGATASMVASLGLPNRGSVQNHSLYSIGFYRQSNSTSMKADTVIAYGDEGIDMSGYGTLPYFLYNGNQNNRIRLASNYIEAPNVPSGTIASGGVLGLNSSGKIVKADIETPTLQSVTDEGAVTNNEIEVPSIVFRHPNPSWFTRLINTNCTTVNGALDFPSISETRIIPIAVNGTYADGNGNIVIPTGSGTINSGSQYRLAYYAAAGTTLSEGNAITGSRILVSDNNGVPVHGGASATEAGYLSGVTSAIQTQLDGKQSTLTNSAELAAALSDETGSGVSVFGTSPTFTTDITTPKVIGGTGTTSTLTFQPTSGVGTTGADMIFQGGNNGATAWGRWLHGGSLIVGNQSALVGTEQLSVQNNQNNATRLTVSNTTAGTASQAAIFLQTSGSVGFDINHYSASFSTSGSAVAASTRLQSNGANGLSIGTGNSAPLLFRIGATERWRIDVNGSLCNTVATGNTSAAFEVSSTSKGLLLPRMTKTQRDAISSPSAGLAIYQTDNTPGLRVYNGTNWIKYSESTD